MSDPSRSEILLYQSPDNRTRIDVRLDGETVWLSQAQMAELFQTTKQNVSLHVRNVFEEKELDAAATVKQYLTVQTEGGREVQRRIDFYNLDVIISVGYRVRSGSRIRRGGRGATPPRECAAGERFSLRLHYKATSRRLPRGLEPVFGGGLGRGNLIQRGQEAFAAAAPGHLLDTAPAR